MSQQADPKGDSILGENAAVAAGRPLLSELDATAVMSFPHIKLDHLLLLCDDTGVFQHAAYGVPNRNEGYCTDDVARAIVFLCRYEPARSSPQLMEVLSRCISFLHFANRPDGTFHNFLLYDRTWNDSIGSEDSQGRALWSAGTASRSAALSPAARHAAQEVFRRSAHRIAQFRSPRSSSFAMLGCADVHDIDIAQDMLRTGANFLLRCFDVADYGGWHWFERYLTYCNARIPQALYMAYSVLKNEEYFAVAERSLQFLIQVMFEQDVLSVPGNHAWYEAGGRKSEFDQQPVEAGTMVEALSCAYRLTGNPAYLQRAQQALMWYHGRNRHGQSLIDTATGACYDGLMPSGINRNQGAEATLSYLLARCEYEAAIRATLR